MTDLTLDEATHTYRLGDRVLPSVTQITATIAPLFGSPRGVLEAKADLGTAVHLATQFYDEGDLDRDSLPAVVLPYLDAYVRFRQETGFKPIAVEEKVFSELYGFAGTLDRVGEFTKLKGGRRASRAIVDLKATYRILPASGPQTAGYQYAWNERRPSKKADRRFVLQLKADQTYRLEECADPTDWSVFASALTILHWTARHGGGYEARK